jgi:hypothetical protein
MEKGKKEKKKFLDETRHTMRTFDEEADSRVCIGKKADEKLQKEMKSERV